MFSFIWFVIGTFIICGLSAISLLFSPTIEHLWEFFVIICIGWMIFMCFLSNGAIAGLFSIIVSLVFMIGVIFYWYEG